MTEVFTCSKCRDSGFLHPTVDGKVHYSTVVVCSCRAEEFEREKQLHLMKRCHLPFHTEHMTLENFKTYDNESLVKALNYAKQLAHEEDGVKCLTLFGKVDNGKTHLAVATCRSWLERGKSARYAFVPLLLNELRNGYSQEGEQSYQMTLDFLCRVGLLVLDDLAVESATPWAREQIQTIVHYRGINGLPMMVTTNKAVNDLGEIDWEHRISSRLQREDFCRGVYIDAPEHRLEEKNNT